MYQKTKDVFSKHLHLILMQLYELHFDRLCEAAMGYVCDEQAACDIVNDSFVALSQELSKILNDSMIADLLSSYTREKCRSFVQNIPSSIEPDYADQHCLETGNNREEWQPIVRNAVAGLSPQRKKIIEYMYWDGLSSDEIATKMGLSRQTVLNQKISALRWLKPVIRNELSKLS